MDSPPIPGELLVDIFLRLPNPADLVHVSAGCTSFRHLIADTTRNRLFGDGQAPSLNTPPFLCFLGDEGVFHAVVTPHPSASAASAVTLAADSSFSFLPGPASYWAVQDVRDGRVLLERYPKFEVIFREVAVCDPLHRRYLQLPPIPGDLAESVDDALWIEPQAFLASSGDEEETSFSTFAFVFSSNIGQWRAISSQSWSDLFAGLPLPTRMSCLFTRQYTYGCFYWVTILRDNLLVLDTPKMEFSIAEPPPEARGIPGVDIAIVEVMLGMFVCAEVTNYLSYTIRQNNFGSSNQWQLEMTIPVDSRYLFMGSMGRHLFLHRSRKPPDAHCFSLDVNTFQIEGVFVSDVCYPNAHTYSNLPPSLLSTPTISSGFGNRADKETLEQGVAARSSAQ
ncbi:hypothetical protein VPH35_108365 [Triticum aestivum]